MWLQPWALYEGRWHEGFDGWVPHEYDCGVELRYTRVLAGTFGSKYNADYICRRTWDRSRKLVHDVCTLVRMLCLMTAYLHWRTELRLSNAFSRTEELIHNMLQ